MAQPPRSSAPAPRTNPLEALGEALQHYTTPAGHRALQLALEQVIPGMALLPAPAPAADGALHRAQQECWAVWERLVYLWHQLLPTAQKDEARLNAWSALGDLLVHTHHEVFGGQTRAQQFFRPPTAASAASAAADSAGGPRPYPEWDRVCDTFPAFRPATTRVAAPADLTFFCATPRTEVWGLITDTLRPFFPIIKTPSMAHWPRLAPVHTAYVHLDRLAGTFVQLIATWQLPPFSTETTPLFVFLGCARALFAHRRQALIAAEQLAAHEGAVRANHARFQAGDVTFEYDDPLFEHLQALANHRPAPTGRRTGSRLSEHKTPQAAAAAATPTPHRPPVRTESSTSKRSREAAPLAASAPKAARTEREVVVVDGAGDTPPDKTAGGEEEEEDEEEEEEEEEAASESQRSTGRATRAGGSRTAHGPDRIYERELEGVLKGETIRKSGLLILFMYFAQKTDSELSPEETLYFGREVRAKAMRSRKRGGIHFPPVLSDPNTIHPDVVSDRLEELAGQVRIKLVQDEVNKASGNAASLRVLRRMLATEATDEELTAWGMRRTVSKPGTSV